MFQKRLDPWFTLFMSYLFPGYVAQFVRRLTQTHRPTLSQPARTPKRTRAYPYEPNNKNESSFRSRTR